MMDNTIYLFKTERIIRTKYYFMVHQFRVVKKNNINDTINVNWIKTIAKMLLP